MERSKTYKIAHCFGSRDAWKWVRKNKWKALGGKPYDQLLYSKIIDAVNKHIVELVLDGKEVEFPHKMGSLRAESTKCEVYIEDGKVKDTYPVLWTETHQLWAEDEEARKKHLYVKNVTDRWYLLKYSKDDANYPNKQFYLFRHNRAFGKRFTKLAYNGKLNVVEFEK